MFLALRFLLVLFPVTLFCQELPPHVNYPANQYKAGNQNWMISQGSNNKIYVANGSGLLEFTGTAWNLYKIPNQTVIRSVKACKNRVYTGAYMELGYWEENEFGVLKYKSLVPELPKKLEDGEQFWNIENVGDFIIFQSFENLYFYNSKNDQVFALVIPWEEQILKLFRIDNGIYFQISDRGLFTIEEGEIATVIHAEILKYVNIIQVYFDYNHLHLITQSGEFYKWNGKNLIPVFPELDESLADINIFSAKVLPNKSFVLGTVAEGIYTISPTGKILYHYDQENGLQNNTVLSLFADNAGNIWAGLDNGISVINLDSHIKVFHDQKGKIGAVYASFQNEEYLYLGTNQGLYFRRNGSEEFKLIPGTNGQIWSLNGIDGYLFAGHNTGTFLVEGGTAEKISEKTGTWIVKKIKENPLVLVQGHYNGISFLRKEKSIFTEFDFPGNFPHSSKSIVSRADGNIWVGNEHKGVFAFDFNTNSGGIEVENYQFPEVSGISAGIFNFNDTLYYSTTDQLFQFEPDNNNFSAEKSRLGEMFNNIGRISGKIVKEDEGAIWGFAEDFIFKIKLGNINSAYQFEPFYIPKEFRNITRGYENISALNNGSYLLGIIDGFLVIDDAKIGIPTYDVRIDKVSVSALDGSNSLAKPGREGHFSFSENNIKFNFSIPEFQKFIVPQYSFRLLGLSQKWSNWNKKSVAEFNNLSFGEYRFQVRAKIKGEIIGAQNYSFEISPPWYLSLPLIFSYFILFVILLYLIIRFNKKRHQKIIEKKEKTLQLKNLEAEQEIIKLQNEQLEKDMATKSNELAISTMSLIKKNEFLSDLKNKLIKANSPEEIELVIKTINREIEGEDNWEFFKEAFSNADKDFFKKLKSLHPNLTPNDLKLCAYLRLNLSSKEIAPLLNISVKSVEIKRYRLRKKMELDRNINLVEYILSI